MRNAPIQNAAVAAGPARRSGLARALVVSLALCTCVSAALAGPGDDQERRGGHAERAVPPAPRVQEAPRNDARLEQQMRQEQMRAYDEQQRRAQIQAQQQAAQEGFRRNGRLTPDERRDLRRQIGEAGQDIYSNTPRR